MPALHMADLCRQLTRQRRRSAPSLRPRAACCRAWTGGRGALQACGSRCGGRPLPRLAPHAGALARAPHAPHRNRRGAMTRRRRGRAVRSETRTDRGPARPRRNGSSGLLPRRCGCGRGRAGSAPRYCAGAGLRSAVVARIARRRSLQRARAAAARCGSAQRRQAWGATPAGRQARRSEPTGNMRPACCGTRRVRSESRWEAQSSRVPLQRCKGGVSRSSRPPVRRIATSRPQADAALSAHAAWHSAAQNAAITRQPARDVRRGVACRSRGTGARDHPRLAHCVFTTCAPWRSPASRHPRGELMAVRGDECGSAVPHPTRSARGAKSPRPLERGIDVRRRSRRSARAP